MTFSNKLTPAEAERLAMLAEECGEVIQIVGKILRHGYESRHPDGGPSNRLLLTKELGDIQCVVGAMDAEDDIQTGDIRYWASKKQERIDRYTHHQPKSQEPNSTNS